jgi:formiminotetrahydrofolate cyclodeaminase
MRSYGPKFKSYLSDLGKRIPAPGGGSAICLSFCLGVSLIEKTIQYSFNKKHIRTRHLNKFEKLKKRVYPYIDLDGKIFSRLMSAKAKKRRELLRRSEKIVIDTAKASWEAISLAKKVESGIKKGIISDFYIGSELIKVSLMGCILNLEANSRIFGKGSPHIKKFKGYLKSYEGSRRKRSL